MWCCTRTDIVREHLEDTQRICDISSMGLYLSAFRVHTLLPTCIYVYQNGEIKINLGALTGDHDQLTIYIEKDTVFH